MSGFRSTNHVPSIGAMCLIKAIYLVHAVVVVLTHGRGSCCDHTERNSRKSVVDVHTVMGSYISRLEFLFVSNSLCSV